MEWLAVGIGHFTRGRFLLAAEAFEHALRDSAEPGYVPLLASHTFLRLQHPPARKWLDESIARPAVAAAGREMGADPHNIAALHALGARKIQSQSWDETTTLFKRLLSLDGQDAAAMFGVGWVAYTRWHPDWEQALRRAGMSVEDPGANRGPLPDPIRRELDARHGPAIREGIERLEQALTVEPQFVEGLGLLSSLTQARAYLRTNQPDFDRDRAEAYELLKRSMAARKQQPQ